MAFLNPQLIVDGFKPIEQPNPVNALMQALQIQHLQAQSDAARFQMQTQQNALQRQLGIESIYRGLPAGSTPQQISEALTQAGHGAEGLKYAQGAADMGKDLAQTNKWNTDSAKTKVDSEHQQIVATGGILMAASKAGPDAVMEALAKSPTIPEDQRASWIARAQANPIGFAQQFAQGTMSAQQQQELETKMQQSQMTDRHQRATENLTARGQDMTAGSAAARLMTDRTVAAKPPSGYRPTATGLEAIPGGPADLKLQGVLNQDTATLTSSTASMDRLATAANEAMNHPGLAGTTGKLGALPNIPGGQAANAAALLNTLKSQVAFGVLQDMRNNSKTGGALGNVSDAEGKRLEANLAALEKSQSVEQLKANLQKIIDYTSEAKDRLRGAYNLKHTAGASGSAPAKTVVQTGNYNGRKVVKYSDGTIDYAP